MKKYNYIEIPEGHELIQEGDVYKIVKKDEVWRPRAEEYYYSIEFRSYLGIITHVWSNDDFDKNVLEIGNCFRTEEEAKKSYIYFAMNSEYEYWHPGMEQPEDKEGWEVNQMGFWDIESNNNGGWQTTTRRRLKNKGVK